MRAHINPPPPEEISSTTYLEACIFALEPSIESLLAGAVKSGWRHEDVRLALMTLIMNDNDGVKFRLMPLHS